MSKTIQLIAQVVIGALVMIAIHVMLVKFGEPQSVWLYCEIMELCHGR